MKAALLEYQLAFQENLDASKDEVTAKDRKRKAYYRLMRAKEGLKAIERELLDETIVV